MILVKGQEPSAVSVKVWFECCHKDPTSGLLHEFPKIVRPSCSTHIVLSKQCQRRISDKVEKRVNLDRGFLISKCLPRPFGSSWNASHSMSSAISLQADAKSRLLLLSELPTPPLLLFAILILLSRWPVTQAIAVFYLERQRMTLSQEPAAIFVNWSCSQLSLKSCSSIS